MRTGLSVLLASAIVLPSRIVPAQTSELRDAAAAFELLVSPLDVAHDTGLAWLTAHREDVVAERLDALAGDDAAAATRSANELRWLLSPYACDRQRAATNKGFSNLGVSSAPVGRVSDVRDAARVRAATVAALDALFDRASDALPGRTVAGTDDSVLAVRSRVAAQLELLGELADTAVADRVAAWTAAVTDTDLGTPLGGWLASWYCRPPFFVARGICGNSSAEEMAAFLTEETVRAAAGRAAALAWHAAHRSDEPAARVAAGVAVWPEALVGHGVWFEVGTLEPLLRAGPLALDATVAWQRPAAPAELRFAAALLRARIRGEVDDAALRKALAADDQQRLAALTLILAAADRRHAAVLARLAKGPYPVGTTAAELLGRLHRADARDALEAARAASPDPWAAAAALDELRAWGL